MSNSIQESLAQSWNILSAAPVADYRLDARILLAHAGGFNIEYIVAHHDEILSEQIYNDFQELVKRRAAREPISHIIGKREFWKDTFHVSSDVLDPRADSEVLIEGILKDKTDKNYPYKILDLGTGSGCLLLSLLREYPNATGIGVDISYQALKIAQKNAKNLHLNNKCNFICSNWGKTIDSSFDIVISNPPYIANADILDLEDEVKEYEPNLALSGGDDGLKCYRDLTPQINRLLNKQGIALFEIGSKQTDDVSLIIDKAGLRVTQVIYDLAPLPRAVIMKHY